MLVRRQDHSNPPTGGFGDAHHLEALAFGLLAEAEPPRSATRRSEPESRSSGVGVARLT